MDCFIHSIPAGIFNLKVMTIQYIIVGIIIATAVGTAVWRILRPVVNPKGKCGCCASSGCAGCPIAGKS
jgi:hypothetical protein